MEQMALWRSDCAPTQGCRGAKSRGKAQPHLHASMHAWVGPPRPKPGGYVGLDVALQGKTGDCFSIKFKPITFFF